MPDGRVVERVRLGAAPGVVLDLLTLGATVHRLEVAGADGVRRQVALGRDSVEDLLGVDGFLGASIGRYANRIAGGRFTVDGAVVEVATSDRGNALHGGPDGFDKRLWTLESADDTRAVLSLVSPAGDQGYPGTLTARVTYGVEGGVEGGVVRITLEATTDAVTVVNLTNHTYLNLDGDGAGTIDGHTLQVHASSYLPVDGTGIPRAGFAPVEGTPFDLRRPTALGPLLRLDDPQLAAAGGLDHDFAVDGTGLRTAAVLRSEASGLALELRSDQPGLQVYTGNVLTGPGRAGRRYRQGDGIALEPQLHPDTPNHEGEPGWPSARLAPGETYRHVLEWRFTRDG